MAALTVSTGQVQCYPTPREAMPCFDNPRDFVAIIYSVLCSGKEWWLPLCYQHTFREIMAIQINQSTAGQIASFPNSICIPGSFKHDNDVIRGYHVIPAGNLVHILARGMNSSWSTVGRENMKEVAFPILGIQVASTPGYAEEQARQCYLNTGDDTTTVGWHEHSVGHNTAYCGTCIGDLPSGRRFTQHGVASHN
jgi:hypothetical protein